MKNFNQFISEAKKSTDRDSMIKLINKLYKQANAVPAEKFFSNPKEAYGGIWLRGSEEYVDNTYPIFDYYQDINKTKSGLVSKLDKLINKHGWFVEPYDAGTALIYPSNMIEAMPEGIKMKTLTNLMNEGPKFGKEISLSDLPKNIQSFLIKSGVKSSINSIETSAMMSGNKHLVSVYLKNTGLLGRVLTELAKIKEFYMLRDAGTHGFELAFFIPLEEK